MHRSSPLRARMSEEEGGITPEAQMRQLEEKAVSMRVRPCCLPTPRSRRSAQARARAQVSELHDRIATLKANVGMLAALSVSAGAALATHVAL